MSPLTAAAAATTFCCVKVEFKWAFVASLVGLTLFKQHVRRRGYWGHFSCSANIEGARDDAGVYKIIHNYNEVFNLLTFPLQVVVFSEGEAKKNVLLVGGNILAFGKPGALGGSDRFSVCVCVRRRDNNSKVGNTHTHPWGAGLFRSKNARINPCYSWT